MCDSHDLVELKELRNGCLFRKVATEKNGRWEVTEEPIVTPSRADIFLYGFLTLDITVLETEK